MAASLALLPVIGALAVAPPAEPRVERPAKDRRPAAPRCAAGTANCEAAAGRILYLESVDPDGDGDLHLVIAGGRVTGPGLSVLDIRRDLRPKRDPRPGDWAAAAGPVFTGSYGQRQIQAEKVVLDRLG